MKKTTLIKEIANMIEILSGEIKELTVSGENIANPIADRIMYIKLATAKIQAKTNLESIRFSLLIEDITND